MNIPYIDYTILLPEKQYFISKKYIDNLTNTKYIEYNRSPFGHKCTKCASTHYHKDDKRKRTVIFPPYIGIKMVAIINHNRFKCCNCNSKFVPPFEFVNRNSKLSNTCKSYFEQRIKDCHSMIDIARDCGFSSVTGWRFINSITFDINLEGITGLFFDEFKGNADGEKYQLAIYDQDHKLITILKDRKNTTIRGFLELLDLSKVEFVCTDLYGPFRKLVKSIIPNAIYIADKYHFIRQLSWSIRDRRICLYNLDSKTYGSCKKYWKLLAKNPLSKFTEKQKTRLNEVLSQDINLKKLYEFQIAFRIMCETKANYSWHKRSFDNLLIELLNIGCPESKRLHSTLKNWQDEIINANLTGLSNGFVEGYNNKIKVIKRVSYGIKKFDNIHKLLHLRFNSRASINYGF